VPASDATGTTAGETSRVVLVTGGARGIGAAVAARFLSLGARVYAFDTDPDAVAASTGQHGTVELLNVDVREATDVRDTVDRIVQDDGTIDVLVNNAGIGRPYTLEAMTPDQWRDVLDVNLTGAMNCTQAVIAPMRAAGGGAIVNVASIAGKRMSYHGAADYTASKSGLLGLTRHSAFELAQYGIRVNAVCPGPVLTDMVSATTTQAQRDATAELIPLGRWITPADIAGVVTFLASDDAAMCTGTTIDVDGGMLISNGTPYRDYMAHRQR